MIQTLRFVATWMHITICIFASYVIYWLAKSLLEHDMALTFGQKFLAATILSAMQTGIATWFILLLMPFRKAILSDQPPFIRPFYGLVIIIIILIAILPMIGIGASLGELIENPNLMKAIVRNELIVYGAVFLWGISRSVGLRRSNHNAT